MPGKEEWTILISKNRSVRASNRKEEDDAVLIKVKPQTIPHRERMTFLFSDYDYDKMTVNLEGEKVRISFDLALYTHDQSLENIEEVTGWRPYVRAGRYHYEMKEYEMDPHTGIPTLASSQSSKAGARGRRCEQSENGLATGRARE